jgi:hypothetical protein
MAATTTDNSPTSPVTWIDFYARNREDGGTIEELFEENMAGMAAKTEEHLEDTGTLTDTIIGSSYANMILVPGRPGKMLLLHHGFGARTTDGFHLIFAQGNLSDSVTFKMLPRDEAVSRITTGEGRKAETTPCPSLNSMLGAGSADVFKNLPTEGNRILSGKPNHLLVTPEIFLIAEGAKSINAKELAFEVITWLEADDEDDENTANLKREEAQGVETLLAFLWASENQKLTPIALDDVPDNAKLNLIIRGIKNKVGERGGTPRATPEVAREEGRDNFNVNNLALASVVNALNRMHDSQEAERTTKESESSLFRTMGPTQRQLFTMLCTTDMAQTPVMTEFMKSLSRSKTPQKAVALLKAATRPWNGTFSEGGCHRFLSNGFLSLDANKSNPGGFTVFMFFPKALDISGKAFDGDAATMRDYFGLDVDESTISYYAKQGYFSPENAYDLHIQLRTMRDMLELVTCKDSIIAKGLNYILEPTRWDNITNQLHERFATETNFGTKFCYCMDKPIQMLLDRITKWSSLATEGTPNYLTEKAAKLMEAVEEGMDLQVILPKVLLSRKDNTGIGVLKSTNPPRNSGSPEKPSSKKRKTVGTTAAKTLASHSVSTPGGGRIPQTAASSKTTTATHTNHSVNAAWTPPTAGTDYLSYFPNRMPGQHPWPRFTDDRLRKRNPNATPAPLCVRFQAVGRCSMACTLAHVSVEDMSKEEQESVNKIFREVYANTPSPGP